MYPALPRSVKDMIGRGLTDHPTSSEITAYVTNIGDVAIPKSSHAKIIFYSRGLGDSEIRYPFNVEMNVNHEYWHLRENDPNDPLRQRPDAFSTNHPTGPSRVDLKFSFGNCLDGRNEIRPAPPFGYVPELHFHNQRWMDHLRDVRFPALAGMAEKLRRHLRRVEQRYAPDLLPIPEQRNRRSSRGRSLVWQRREGLRIRHGPPRCRQLAHAVSAGSQCRLRRPIRGRRESANGRNPRPLRLRHVGHAVQLSRQSGPYARRIGTSTLTAPRVIGLADKLPARVG